MKAFWLFLVVGLELSSVSTFCPEKCLCLWYMDHTLTINCSASEQTEVPYGIDPQVRVLDLSHNEITTYNHSKYLKAVEDIFLSNNKITEAYFGNHFKFLRRIDLSFNLIDDLNKVDVTNLQHLTKLNLSYNSKLRRISGLSSGSLEVLDLSHCFIPYVDEGFLDNVSAIRAVDLSFNSFQSLSNVRSDSLETLDASHGRLENLTEAEVFNLPALVTLNVSFNPNLKIDFSYENSCWSVRELDLSSSDVASLDMFPFCSLELLNASLNNIEIIEVRTFFNNCDLNFVNLSKNKISEISPRAFFATDKLKILDLSENQIQNVDFSLHLKQVVNLDLSNNQISDLTGLVLKNAAILNLSHNKIKRVFINFNENAPKLKKLNLSFNKIKKLRRINSRTATQVDLSHCSIASIDLDTFDGAENLIQVNLVGNKLTSLDFRIFKDLDNLKDLMLGHNQWACNCQSQEFKDLYEFLTEARPMANLQELQCLRNNETWRNTCLDAWQKEKEWRKTVYSLAVSLTIALIVVAVILFCKYFNDKRQREGTETEERDRRLSSNENSTQILQVVEPEEVPNRSSTPPPNYEAALLLPKLTEEQKHLAISTLSIACPLAQSENQEEDVEGETESDDSDSSTDEPRQ